MPCISGLCIDLNGVASDLATLLTLTDDPIVALQTPIKGIHIGQLREGIDALRRAAGLLPLWQSYAAASGPIAAADFIAMRDQLNEARAVLQLPPIDFTPALTAGSPL